MAYDSEDFISLGNQRLLALADALETVPDYKYTQAEFRSEKLGCGTVCCALGWGAELIPEILGFKFMNDSPRTIALVRLDGSAPFYSNFSFAMEAFELNDRETVMIFGFEPASRSFYGTLRPTPKIVAAKIREFAMARITAS